MQWYQMWFYFAISLMTKTLSIISYAYLPRMYFFGEVAVQIFWSFF